MKTFNHFKLEKFVKEILLKIGYSKELSELGAKVLLSADLRGIDSHGVARLSGYIRLWEKGRVNSNPQMKIIHETPSTAVLDGDAGLGLVVAPKAMAIAMEKAEKVGTGWVAVQNSNHFGIAGFHSMLALEKDMIGIAFTNASPLVAPTHSNERMLGTNPISIAIPSKTQPHFVADMATTTAANGKLEILQRKKLNTPTGWVQDKDGNAINDAYAVKDGGALLPLGSDPEHGSHKGYILGSIVDIFSAVLSGANYGPWVPPFVAFLEPSNDPVGKGIGHFFGAMRVDAFRPKDEFLKHMDNWIERFRNSKPIHQDRKVLIPGDPEREMERERLLNGIPLLEPVIQDLMMLSNKFEVPFEE